VVAQTLAVVLNPASGLEKADGTKNMQILLFKKKICNFAALNLILQICLNDSKSLLYYLF
jgi:hypothetical protein